LNQAAAAKLIAPPEPPETPEPAKPKRDTSQLLAGNDAMLSARAAKKARILELAQQRKAAKDAAVAKMVKADRAALPVEMRDSAPVRQILFNKANAQVLLDEMIDAVHAGSEGGSVEQIIKLIGAVLSQTDALLAKWPREEQKDLLARRIPKSVADWLDNIEKYEGPVQIIQEEKSGV